MSWKDILKSLTPYEQAVAEEFAPKNEVLDILKDDTEPEWSDEKKNRMREQLKEEGTPDEYIEQFIYEGETKEIADEFGDSWTGTWNKKESRYVEEVGEEESRSTIESILELEGTNLPYEELVERMNDFMKNPTDMVEMPSELLNDEQARDEWFDTLAQFKEDNV